MLLCSFLPIGLGDGCGDAGSRAVNEVSVLAASSFNSEQLSFCTALHRKIRSKANARLHWCQTALSIFVVHRNIPRLLKILNDIECITIFLCLTNEFLRFLGRFFMQKIHTFR